ncbi:response regulator [Rickettsiella endosymbiont of Dermanyssus gallinae]|uniref:response regulator n=1 Tax=Rickettsiella endosymbiont of Dermanyssus gallinae TaxID=2856608 RepID=UPI001C52DE32|nr:response regulator [Rickettsiella endosymbiont of Dermanyssus gallinae]
MEQQNEIRDKKIVKEILLVEDCAIQVKALCRFLYLLEYQVEIARDAKTAIQFIQNKPYTLIVTDLGLPDDSGELVIEETRKSEFNQLTPLIVCTGHADSKKEEKCKELGAQQVLIKPIYIEMLKKAIEKCLMKKGLDLSVGYEAV